MQVEASRGPIEQLDVQALAVAVFKNEKADEGFLKNLDELSGGLVRADQGHKERRRAGEGSAQAP